MGLRLPFSFRTGGYLAGKELNAALQQNFDYLATKYQDSASALGLSNDNPRMDGSVDPGTEEQASRSDHRHPVDTSRLSATASVSGDLTGSMPSPKLKYVVFAKWS